METEAEGDETQGTVEWESDCKHVCKDGEEHRRLLVQPSLRDHGMVR